MAKASMIERLFEEAVDLPVEQQETFLRAHCPDDELRIRLARLLEAHAGSPDFLEESASVRFSRLLQAPGTYLGEFEIIEKIADGGMASVYLARDTVLDRQVALKVLGVQQAMSRRAREKFLHEARAAAALKHPNIVPVYRYGEADGFCYIAMEHVPNGTFTQWLKQLGPPENNSEQLKRIVRVFATLADALEHAHSRGVVHRDVKPGNVLMRPDDHPMLADFGIALITEETISSTSQGVGTAHYMSPEQIAASEAGVDHRTDIFSLGVMFYEALTGEKPFQGSTLQAVLYAIRAVEPRRIRSIRKNIPADLETICHKALEKNAQNRYPAAAHMATDLKCWLSGVPILARPPSLVRRVSRIVYRYRVAAIITMTLLLGGGAGAMWQQLRPTDLATLTVSIGHPHETAQVRVNPIVWDEDGVLATERIGDSALQYTLRTGRETHRRLASGAYMVIIEAEDGTLSEVPIVLAARDRAAINVMLRPVDEVTVDMVLIPAANGANAFWIDRYEVSNAQYLQFLDSLDDAAERESLRPPWWGDEYHPEWDDLPVTGVTWHAAVRYATWAGKRLPTREEWDRAVGGEGDAQFPWRAPLEDDPLPLGRAPFELLSSEATRSALRESRAALLSQLVPVNQPRTYVVGDAQFADQTPEGIVSLFGNVMEWTASVPPPSVLYTTEEDRMLHRAIKGFAWERLPGPPPEIVTSYIARKAANPVAGVGFRCARSAPEVNMPAP